MNAATRSKSEGGWRSPHRGMSLVELLVVIAVIGVLIGILLPALRSAMKSGATTVTLSNIRGIGVVIELYAQAYKGSMPFHALGEPYRSSPRDVGVTITTNDPWAMASLWASTLHDIAPWREHYRSWLAPGVEYDKAEPWNGRNPSYAYCCSFLARPECWDASAPASDPETHFSGVSAHEVATPSIKALMFERERPYLGREPTPDDRRAVLACDGAAELRLDRSATSPVQNRADDRTPATYHDTPRGVRGADF